MSKVEISRENIVAILESKSPKTLTDVYRLLGAQGKKLSGSVAKKIRELVPGIEERLASNKASAETAMVERIPKGDGATNRISKKSKGVKKTSKTGQFPHSKDNPFRPNSNYALAFDVLASFPDGLPLATWRELYAKAAKKSLKLASFDTQVLLTAKDRPTSERHRSCRSGFYIERQCDHVTLKT